MTDQQNVTDFALLMHNRQPDRLFQNGTRDLHFQFGEQAVLRPLPTRQHLTLRIEHLRVRPLFGGRNQGQRFSRGGLVVEHYRRFHGVADRARNELQVVIGVHPQRENAQQGQRYAGHRHGYQRHNQMATANDRSQRRAASRTEQFHGAAGLRRDNCSTLGWMRTPLRATESRLTSKDTCSSPTRRQNRLPTVH